MLSDKPISRNFFLRALLSTTNSLLESSFLQCRRMNSKYYLVTMPPICQSDFKIAWNDGGNSMGEEYDLPSEK